MLKNRMRPIHPGEVLHEEYMVPLGLSAQFAKRNAASLVIPRFFITISLMRVGAGQVKPRAAA